MTLSRRTIAQIIEPESVIEGAGVKLKRSIGTFCDEHRTRNRTDPIRTRTPRRDVRHDVRLANAYSVQFMIDGALFINGSN